MIRKCDPIFGPPSDHCKCYSGWGKGNFRGSLYSTYEPKYTIKSDKCHKKHHKHSPQPSVIPSPQPSMIPSPQPSVIPSPQPSMIPSPQPSVIPSPQPSMIPSPQPSMIPSPQPSMIPSPQPSMIPSPQPSMIPSPQPSMIPSPQPSMIPSPQPSMIPSPQPSTTPSPQPSDIQKLWNSCENCAKIDNQKLVGDNTLFQKPWKEVGKDVYGCNDTENCHFNAIDMAKSWIIGTDGIRNNIVSSNNAQGGCASCQSAIAVALAEGGNQVGQGEVQPITDSLPRNMYDPTFTTKICNNDEKCTNGAYWQVSSAFIPGDKVNCPDCEKVGCSSLENPICSAKIAIQHSMGVNDYSRSCPNGTRSCNSQDLQKGIDPNCYFGPFGLCSAGWNSPSCSQLYRKAYGKDGYKTFGRIAINACRQAADELKSVGWKSSSGSCEIDDPLMIKSMKDHTNGKGTWTIPITNPCRCGDNLCLES